MVFRVLHGLVPACAPDFGLSSLFLSPMLSSPSLSSILWINHSFQKRFKVLLNIQVWLLYRGQSKRDKQQRNLSLSRYDPHVSSTGPTLAAPQAWGVRLLLPVALFCWAYSFFWLNWRFLLEAVHQQSGQQERERGKKGGTWLRFGTYHFCSDPVEENRVTWPYQVAREARQCAQQSHVHFCSCRWSKKWLMRGQLCIFIIPTMCTFLY